MTASAPMRSLSSFWSSGTLSGLASSKSVPTRSGVTNRHELATSRVAREAFTPTPDVMNSSPTPSAVARRSSTHE